MKIKVRDLEPGFGFDAGPAVVIILEHFEDGKTLVITKDCIGFLPFNDDSSLKNKRAGSHWITNTLRSVLNDDFLNEFDTRKGLISSNDIILSEWDVKDVFFRDHSKSIDKIGLLTTEMFKKYRRQGLLRLDEFWWLMNPDGFYTNQATPTGLIRNAFLHESAGVSQHFISILNSN